MSGQPLPLCVDLDGTLIRSDLLLESILLLIKRNPLFILMVPWWLLGGKAALKANIAKRVELNPAALPYNTEFLAWLVEQRHAGRALWLCTGSNYRLAKAVAAHLGMFDDVLASDDESNMSGAGKAKRLVEQFGEKGFDYCGNAAVDVAIWQVSHRAVVVNGSAALEERARSVSELEKVFSTRKNLLRAIIRGARLHQWAKNALVFVPLFAAHKVGDLHAFAQACLAFSAFCCCSSSVYLLNDMLDLEADRLHPRKSRRPFAAGELSLVAGFVLVPALVVVAMVIASFLPGRFLIVIVGYYVLTLAYSFELKRVVLLDVLSLAGLYTTRIIAGARAVVVPLSFWLLLFSVFLFLSLALVKRYAELETMRADGRLVAAGRGYRVEDLQILQSLGIAAGYLSVLVLALYINTPSVAALYHHSKAIWFLCVLMLYWISRIWLMAHRGTMHDDPVIFALRDRVSLATGALAAVTVAVAL